MLTPSDLAQTPDFVLGELGISPSRRTVSLGETHFTLEPRMMQVLVLLARANGEVVTRQTLHDEVWGVPVGDDSLNRAVAGVRRALELDSDLVLETIPRTGYRLDTVREKEADPPPGVSRRAVALGVGAAGLAAAVGGYALFASRAVDPRVAQARQLREQAHQLLREAMIRELPRARSMLEKATTLDPGNAEGWGLLALTHRWLLESGPADQATLSLQRTERAASRALALDPVEGNALAALAMLEPEFGQWLTVEKRLLAALERAPRNVPLLTGLGLVYQSVGRVTEGFIVNERAIEIDPLDVTPAYRDALKLWITGKIEEADRALARALVLWPRHPIFWNTRILVYTFSGRPRAALRLMDDAPSPLPGNEGPEQRWRVICGTLLASPDERRAIWGPRLVDAVKKSRAFAVHGTMAFSEAGMLDEAFDLAEGYFRGTGPFASAFAGSDMVEINDMNWRRTMMLFTPGCKAMRRDPRFQTLCDYTGLTDYWRRSGTRPDAFVMP